MNALESSLQHLTANSFDEAVASADRPLVVDFWAPWCGPCRMMEPVLDQFAEQHASKIQVAKVNVDEAPALAAKFQVRSIPTLIVFEGGAETDRFSGSVDQAELEQRLKVGA